MAAMDVVLSSLSELSEKLNGLSEGQAVIKSQVAAIQIIVSDNTKTLRGNGVPGITTEIALLKDEVAELKDRIPEEAICRKDMRRLEDRVTGYPSFLWLLRFKPKSTIAITLGMLFVLYVVVSPLVDHGMLAALLTWIGVPVTVVKTLVG